MLFLPFLLLAIEGLIPTQKAVSSMNIIFEVHLSPALGNQIAVVDLLPLLPFLTGKFFLRVSSSFLRNSHIPPTLT